MANVDHSSRSQTHENYFDVILLQIDISGRCPVTYTTSSGFSYDTISKEKNMLACIDGHNYDTVFHGIPYTVDSVSARTPPPPGLYLKYGIG